MKLFNEGRAAIITGAAQGIGFAAARKFVEEGISFLAIVDINEERITKAAKELRRLGDAKILPFACDISDGEAVSKMIEEIETAFGRIDILVNNAGITKDIMFHKMSFEAWDSVLNVNLYGIFNMTRAVINGMRERSYGRIVNISSVVAYGNAGQANYSTTKAGIIGFTKTLAKEGARKGVTVNAIAPDFINTPMMQAVPEDFMNDLKAKAPMQRMGEPEEVANVIAFLSSEDASYVSGVCVDVSGAFRT